MALAKGAYVIRHLKGPKKRSSEDNEWFEDSFERLIKMVIKSGGSEGAQSGY